MLSWEDQDAQQGELWFSAKLLKIDRQTNELRHAQCDWQHRHRGHRAYASKQPFLEQPAGLVEQYAHMNKATQLGKAAAWSRRSLLTIGV